MNVIIDAIYGSKVKNDFMHACDMFENFKQLGEYGQFKVSGKPDMKKLIINFKESLEKCGINVVFLSIRQVGLKLTNKYDNYIKPGTASITDGNNWGMFHSVLKDLGYEVKTDDRMRVTSAKLKL